jgi:hypothetical protein
MESFLIPAKQPLRFGSAETGFADLSLDSCPRSFSKELLASFPDCIQTLKSRPECKSFIFLAVHKTSMSMASFSPDTGMQIFPVTTTVILMFEQKLSANAFSTSTLNCTR